MGINPISVTEFLIKHIVSDFEFQYYIDNNIMDSIVRNSNAYILENTLDIFLYLYRLQRGFGNTFLSNGFIWMDSVEGFTYWHDINKSLIRNEQ